MKSLRQDLPLPIAIFLAALLLPPELSLHLGGLRLSGYRVVLLILFLPMLYRLLTSPRVRVTPADLGMMFVSAWCLLALAANHDLLSAIEKGGILIAEMLGSYLLARVYITSYDKLVAVTKFLLVLVAVVLIVSIPESLSGLHYLRGSNITIYPERMGLHRAYGPFDHPILHGVYCAAAFSYGYYLLVKNAKGSPTKFLPVAIICGATFFSLSAGPYIALATQIGLLAWDRLTHNINGRWWIVIGAICAGYIVLDLSSNRSPVAILISHFSFSGQTAYFRLLIFDYGYAEVMRHPLLGIGFNEWVRPGWMPPSVDNFWLLTAMRYGIPALLGIVGVMIYLTTRLGYNGSHSDKLRDAARAWGFTLAGFVVVGCTVAFWNATFVLFFFLLGSGCWLLERQNLAQVSEPTPVNLEVIWAKPTLF